MNLDPSQLSQRNSNGNSYTNDWVNWCTASSTYGLGDYGTPGSANDNCQPTSSNSPPVVDDFILEYNAGSYEALYASVLGSDPDYDSWIGTVMCYVNGGFVGSVLVGAPSGWYDDGSFALDQGSPVNNGDTVICEIEISDGTDTSALATNSIILQNDPPTITSIEITPSVAYASDSLTCTVTGYNDPDGDTVGFTYSLSLGATMSQGGTQIMPDNPNTVSSGYSAGDQVWCEVTANDYDQNLNFISSGTPVSTYITIQNSPPTISSVALTPTNAYAGDTLVCTASGANDIDGDAITFSYEWIVNGISYWNLGATYNGALKDDTVNCMITPYDGTSYGPAVSSNSITIQNSAPSISSVAIGYSTQQHTSGTFAGDQLTCTPSGGSDADGDVLTYAYTWYLNGVSHSTTQNLDTTGMSSGDVVYCSVVANDGTDNSAAVNSASTTVYTIHNINIQNMAYSPSSITITQGDILIWTNLDSVGHTVTEDGSSPTFNSGTLTNGQTYTLTGLSAGTYTYHCQPHPSMTGTIIVQ